jgi:predicted heme/steroid binding protein
MNRRESGTLISELKETQQHTTHALSWKLIESKWDQMSQQWKLQIDKITLQLTDLKSSMETFETWRKEKWTQAEQDSDPKALLKLLKKKIELDHLITEQQTKTYSRVKFDVGGRIFVTSKSTLQSQKGSLFEKILTDGGQIPLTEEGAYFLDRNPKYFEWILDFCRSAQVPAIDTNEAWNLWMEAQFFHMDNLSARIEEHYSSQFAEKFQHWPLFATRHLKSTSSSFAPVSSPLKTSLSTTDRHNYTKSLLAEYDGSDPKKPILIGVHGNVFDVSQSSSLYGKSGAFAHFAGKDATLIFLNQHNSVDYSKLSTEEASMLTDWESAFKTKYPIVGKLIDE